MDIISSADSHGFVLPDSMGFPPNIPHVVLLILQITLHLSTLCLVLSTIVYMAMYKEQSFHRWTQFSYILPLAVFFLIQCLVYDSPFLLYRDSNSQCKLLAIATSFTLMSIYTSLLAMNLDIFWIFRKTVSKSISPQTFAIIQITSWGLAITDIVLGMTLDALEYENDWLKRPKYGEVLCRQSPWDGKHYICFVVVALNIFVFTATLVSITIHYSGPLPVRSTNEPKMAKRLKMFFKLCIIMGLAWPSSICAAIKGRYADSDWMKWVVFILTVVGNMQGIVIFGIFICTRRTASGIKRLVFKKGMKF